jgi:hypothetical protein
MKRNFFVNSPLEKGDKGVVKQKWKKKTKKQPPPPPLLRGNISEILCFFPCSAGLMGKSQLADRGKQYARLAIIDE